MMVVVLVLLMVVALIGAAFCAGSETGFLSVSRGRVLHMARMGGAHAKIVQCAIADMGRTTTTLLIGNNLSAVTYSSVSAALAASYLPSSAVVQTIWSVFAAFVMLYVGEFLPKLLCSARPLRRTLQVAPVWIWVRAGLYPIVAVFDVFLSWILPRRENRVKVTPTTVLKILEDRKDGVRLSELESALISRLMVLRSKGQEVTPESLLKALDENDRVYEGNQTKRRECK